ncbi:MULTISPECIES: gluconokinase [unclassified Curtobacterium]|uniref:gluconokinase n=1 Tax=unclassified Curtobacterium TaxID=257496 RepID=UPI0021ACB737|nr:MULTISPECIES: gluconokinase [unclassified Curtobacterium]WIB62950.1 gluconokinase [Curtobacterium sp. MCBD17_040]WIE53947.1 gluconokinase [Curtobacterium sp. MCBD17_003]
MTGHRPVVVMGVSGSGKTTIGSALTRHWEGTQFVDADDLHPQANKEKMRSGHPLTDEDRWPWLDICAARIAAIEAQGQRCVMANSALKRVYRDRLRSTNPDLFFVFLTGDEDVIAERQRRRHHEYMPDSLLGSQLATLEPLQADEAGLVVRIDQTLESVIQSIDSALVTR